jgi:hypothetical protein
MASACADYVSRMHRHIDDEVTTSSSSGGSAVILPVPEAETLVGAWRRHWDPMANLGVPAHITLLYPFLPVDRIGEGEVTRLRDWFSLIPDTEIVFPRTGRFDRVLYLAPEPEDFLRSLTLGLWSMYPETPPYGGLHQDIIPHLTAVHTGDESVLNRAERELSRQLPIGFWAKEAWLLVEAPDGHWHLHKRFGFGGRRS